MLADELRRERLFQERIVRRGRELARRIDEWFATFHLLPTTREDMREECDEVEREIRSLLLLVREVRERYVQHTLSPLPSPTKAAEDPHLGRLLPFPEVRHDT